MSSKKYAGNTVVETYAYNVRGWLTEKNSSKFNMKLRYNNPSISGTQARYNGNITEWEWKQGANTPQTYTFTYDGISRLTDNKQYTQSGSSWNPTNQFVEQGLTYDMNGNIESLKRYSNASLLDNLGYTYTGNQLITLTENGTSGTYNYDKNGNMTKDSRKNLDYEYNSLNLLSEVLQGSTSKAKYTYAADGTKLAVSGGGDGYDYRGSLIYKRNNNSLTLESAAFSDGHITKTNSTYVPNYFITDHLGSVRVIFDAGGTVLEQNDYYAFGDRHLNSTSTASDNRFKYNGKELQTTGDVGFLDYGARMYDDKLGRIHSQDLLQEDYYGISPYAYCLNNSVCYVDIFGLKPDDPLKTIDYGEITISPNKSDYGWLMSYLRMLGSNNQNDEVERLKYKNELNSIDVDRLSMLLNYQKGQRVLPGLDGFWETFGFYLFGRTYEGYQIDRDGRSTGLKIVTGTAPTPGKIKGGSLFIKGAGKVGKGLFHIQTKKAILNAAGRSNFTKTVGRNPNIEINKAGEIILKGVQKDGFAGKIYNTGLSAKDFLK